ncbi:hypothetical protein THTE_1991 [Thermogutta terrifontis]|uniref:Uncharacterized protein n=1 Tax=Thermogutta terrifontis TaxID=1331910 RepID=A0A286RF55_9BACT|nr:hypothetical protein THTE_1991 [Thermogutta terrifontis]
MRAIETPVSAAPVTNPVVFRKSLRVEADGFVVPRHACCERVMTNSFLQKPELTLLRLQGDTT